MGLLDILEKILVKPRRGTRVELKEIYCNRADDDFIKSFRTPVVGSEYSNVDSSERQAALQKLKVGEKVRLIWEGGESGSKDKIYVLRGGKGRELAMPDCFGRLNDKVTSDVIQWLTREKIITAAHVADITGGTSKRPKLSCVLELRTYPGPDKTA
jgi:hypothetical protein